MVNLKTYRDGFLAEKGGIAERVCPKLVTAWMDALGCGGAITASTPALNAASGSFERVLPP